MKIMFFLRGHIQTLFPSKNSDEKKVKDSVTSEILLVLLSSTTSGSKKNVNINSFFSPACSVCFSKQKHPTLLRYTPKGAGDTLKVAEPEDKFSLSFYFNSSVIFLILCLMFPIVILLPITKDVAPF